MNRECYYNLSCMNLTKCYLSSYDIHRRPGIQTQASLRMLDICSPQPSPIAGFDRKSADRRIIGIGEIYYKPPSHGAGEVWNSIRRAEYLGKEENNVN